MPARLPLLLASLLLGAAACSTRGAIRDTAADAGWVDFSAQTQVTGFETRFRKQVPFTLDAGQQATLQAACPTLTRGQAVKESASFHLIRLQGQGLDQNLRVAAAMPDKTLADANAELQGDTLLVPVACTHCILFLGLQLPDGRYAACTGPGHSLTLSEGTLTSP